MSDTARPRPTLRFRGRSFLALVLTPDPPVAEWLAELDVVEKRSPGFFAGRALILDVSRLQAERAELEALVAALDGRGIRVMGIEGSRLSTLGLGMPPLLAGGRDGGEIVAPDKAAAEPAAASEAAPPKPAAETPAPAAAPAAAAAPARAPQSSLLIDAPVRSGQSIIHLDGDVIVVGSVASGAEIVAGGSIHVYGTLRGRVFAGSTGNAGARVFCRKLDAELLAIDGYYRTAETMEPEFRDRSVQAWLEGESIIMAAH